MKTVFLLLLAVASALAAASGASRPDTDQSAAQKRLAALTQSVTQGVSSTSDDPAYGLALGPELPGLGSNCELSLLPPGAAAEAEAGVKLVSYGSWLSALTTSVRAKDGVAYQAGISRLCGLRYNPVGVELHSAVPKFKAPQGQTVVKAVATLQKGCTTGNQELYTQGYDLVCPPSQALGPAMPARCDATASDPRAKPASPRRIRLPMFLGVVSEILEEQDQPDDESWRNSMQVLCGDRVYVSGVGFHSHRPLTGSPMFEYVHKQVAALENACGSADFDAEGYRKAWEALCPSAPTNGVVSSAQMEQAEKTAGSHDRLVKLYQGLQGAVLSLAHSVTAASDSVHVALGKATPAQVVMAEDLAAKAIQQIDDWNHVDSLRDVPIAKACSV